VRLESEEARQKRIAEEAEKAKEVEMLEKSKKEASEKAKREAEEKERKEKDACASGSWRFSWQPFLHDVYDIRMAVSTPDAPRRVTAP